MKYKKGKTDLFINKDRMALQMIANLIGDRDRYETPIEDCLCDILWVLLLRDISPQWRS